MERTNLKKLTILNNEKKDLAFFDTIKDVTKVKLE
jgi:hypothetical protein